MIVDVFVDTNILLYTIDENPGRCGKTAEGTAIPADGAVVLVRSSGGRVLRKRYVAETAVSPHIGQRDGVG